MPNNHCPQCGRIRKVTDVVADGHSVSLKLRDGAAEPMEAFCFVICQRYASPRPAVPVTLALNGGEAPAWDIYGRPVYSDQIRCRKAYRARYVAEGTPHVTVCNALSERPSCGRA